MFKGVRTSFDEQWHAQSTIYLKHKKQKTYMQLDIP